ncbi:hypothetical protein ACUOCP_56355, partial [Escherichia sp. R-CC3]
FKPWRLLALSTPSRVSSPTRRLASLPPKTASVELGTLLGVLNASSRQGLNAELTRYTLSLMVLERKLSSAKGALDTLG